MPFSSEQALLQLMLQQPSLAIEARRRGVRLKHFTKKEYGKVFNLICVSYANLNSVPTVEELALFNVKKENIKIEQSFEHLLLNLQNEHNQSLARNAIISAAKSLNTEKPLTDTVKETIQELKSLTDFSEKEKYLNGNDANDLSYQAFLQKEKWKLEGHKGIPLGLELIDQHIGDLKRSWFVIVAARNGVGKSWFLCKNALTAWQERKNVLFLSYEMTTEEVMNRINAFGAMVSPTNISNAELNEDEKNRFLSHMEIAKNEYGNFYINDNPGDIDNIRAIIDDINEKNPDNLIDIVYIDGIYNMRIEVTKEVYVKHQKIAEQSKQLAKDYDIPVVGTHQMTRDFGKTNEKSETLEGGNYGLSGADAYNHQADLIIILHKREEIFKAFNYLNVKIEKFRHGEQGVYFYIEMNLSKPTMFTVDYNEAKERIDKLVPENAPKQTQKSNILMNQAVKIFDEKNHNTQQFAPDVEF